jgi:hypothetical protein
MKLTKLIPMCALAGAVLTAPAAIQHGPRAADQTLGPAILSAVVAADATLVRGAGAVSVERSGSSPGFYFVTFNRSLDDCTVVASVGGTGADAHAGSFAQATVLATTQDAWVTTSDGNDNLVDRPFHLIVFCVK